ncbi:MAG: hypothetical protein ACE5JI_16860, partial [Acidobacteriota bacterium]
ADLVYGAFWRGGGGPAAPRWGHGLVMLGGVALGGSVLLVGLALNRRKRLLRSARAARRQSVRKPASQ